VSASPPPPPHGPTLLARLAIAACVLLPLSFFAGRSVLFDWYRVPTGSMEPTIHRGSRFVPALKGAYQIRVPFTKLRIFATGTPRRGDVVVVRNPDRDSGPPFVQRLMAVGGDTVELRDDAVYLNGTALHAELSSPTESEKGERVILGRETIDGVTHSIRLLPDRPALRTFGPVTVPRGEVFLLGDNRDESRDSRFYGTRSERDRIGRVLGVR
jgi:signal peptidase I